ncbi:MAG TPA: restriction endonuclease subunit M [Desulfobacteraceae bacterium]|nr:restriction endonuclease subunit M [Desulfobacteraceae bacterium]
MTIPEKIRNLVETFDYNLESYKKTTYNETQARREFIDPFFEELGWDIANKQGYAEAYKDVIHEDAIKIGGHTKAPDYCFRIGGARKFFLEAKKPAVNIREDIEPAYQLRRYGWSAKLPLSILTDFEEFAVYDCRIKPVRTDKASHSRILYMKYTDYEQRWDEIANIFSRQAILKGSFDKYAQSQKIKKGTSEVDAAFLQEIERWRDLLARNIALRNPNLSQRQLNFSVQQTIDRIIFLRICEDRGIERYGRLMNLQNNDHVYQQLFQLFTEADDKYNSGLFHFRKEKARENFDNLTPKLNIDDKILKDILKNLYYPDSPYEFSVLPADILGQVYEKFLGKVIRLTPKHQAVVEEKPEVRKAGGVYYTPTYIVNYIVKETIGKLLEGKHPAAVRNIRLLDPACGSGSFLIGAYQFLLDWHLNHYVSDNPEKWATGKKPVLRRTDKGAWRLTTDERKRILLNNIYGVDIDSQAVEVTKLSLLLKVLEGEDEHSLVRQRAMFQERVLPDLANNIRCGNSLIGPDFYDNQQINLNQEDMYRVNVFDWNAEFPEIMKTGGFDAVIGNPPYVNIDDTWGKGDQRLKYIKRMYYSVYNDKTDILYYFFTKAVQLSKSQIGFIVSRAFLEAYKADKLRRWLAEQTQIVEIMDFRNHYVFQGVGITTAIILLDKVRHNSKTNIYQLKINTIDSPDIINDKNNNQFFKHLSVNQNVFKAEPWIFAEKSVEAIIKKTDEQGKPLGTVLIIGQGMQTGRNNIFGKLSIDQIKSWGLKREQYFTRARNSDIARYHINNSGEILLYLENFKNFKSLPKAVQDYLKTYEKELKKRAAYKRGDCEWWRYTWPLHKHYFQRNKLYCPYLANSNRFAFDNQKEFLGLTDTIVLYDNNQNESLLYLMGLLNSKLLTFRFKYIAKLKSNGIFEYFWNSVSKLPIRLINFDIPSDKILYDKMIVLVQQILALHKQLAQAKLPQAKTTIQRQIDATDRQIDRLVYELYGLSEEEIKIVEDNVAT